MAGVPDSYRETSHVHMIVGTTGKKLDEIVGEMKSYTSTQFKKNIKDHPQESRKECLPAGRQG